MVINTNTRKVVVMPVFLGTEKQKEKSEAAADSSSDEEDKVKDDQEKVDRLLKLRKTVIKLHNRGWKKFQPKSVEKQHVRRATVFPCIS